MIDYCRCPYCNKKLPLPRISLSWALYLCGAACGALAAWIGYGATTGLGVAAVELMGAAFFAAIEGV